jgi:hypothetical protein
MWITRIAHVTQITELPKLPKLLKLPELSKLPKLHNYQNNQIVRRLKTTVLVCLLYLFDKCDYSSLTTDFFCMLL